MPAIASPWGLALVFLCCGVCLIASCQLPEGKRPFDPQQRRLVLVVSAAFMVVAAVVTLARGFQWF
jgi:hypothetical protein